MSSSRMASAPPPAWLVAVFAIFLSRVAMAQIQQQQPEGRSLVDWYFFDVGDAPEGRMVSVPLAYHHTGARSFGDLMAQDVAAAWSRPVPTYQQAANARPAPRVDHVAGPAEERCQHQAGPGWCRRPEACFWGHGAGGGLEDWSRGPEGRACRNPAHLCCPQRPAQAGERGGHPQPQGAQGQEEDSIAFPSPIYDPYTHEYVAPGCEPQKQQQPPLPLLPPPAMPSEYFGGQPGPQYTPHRPVHPQPVYSQFTELSQQHPAPLPLLPPSGGGYGGAMRQPPAKLPQKPMQQTPVMTAAQSTPPPTRAPSSPLVPLIDDSAAASPENALSRLPGEVARKMCVEYEKWAPTVRFGPDKDCVPNHTYPIGGNPALPREFPHMAQLGVGRRNSIEWYCGGSLIAPTWILTAAHCIYSQDRQVQWVRLGDLEPDSDTDDSNPQVIAVTKVVRHPEYKAVEVYNDIALVRLAREPDMSTPHVRPACLQVDKQLKKDKLNLIGFGLTEENGDPAPVLMEVALWRTPFDKCASFFGGNVHLRKLPEGLNDDSQLCAGLDQVGKDACQGDSGGPLNTPYSPTCMLNVAGVTSFGQGCGRGVPGVYTRVSHFVPWIEKVVWPEEFQK